MAVGLNSVDSKPQKARRSAAYESLTPLEAALLDLQSESNDRMIEAFQRLEAKVPSPRLFVASASSLLVGVLVLVVYVVSLIAQQRGVDLGEAADATEAVVTVATEATAPTAAPPPAPPPEAPEAAPVVIEVPAVVPVAGEAIE